MSDVSLFPEQAQTLRLTVSEFSERFRRAIERVPKFARISITGEVTAWTAHQNGNLYFTLKDDRAVLSCFAFSSEAKRLPDVPNGTQVVATGSIGIQQSRSTYQLRVYELEPLGLGALAAKTEALRRKLQAEGIFDPARKRAVPAFPRLVAVVSARGKGAEDFEAILRRKAPSVAIAFVETRVEGEGAEIDIADAIDRAGRLRADAIVVTRGGGSPEALYPFNREPVIRAIARATTPLVTAIGHHGDRHLADEAADVAFSTPTAAAEHLAASWLDAQQRLARQNERLDRLAANLVVRESQRVDASRERLDNAAGRHLSAARQRLLETQARLERQSPVERLARRRLRLQGAAQALDAWALRAIAGWQHRTDQPAARLETVRERYFSQRANALALIAGRLDSADPRKPLERGYAIVTLGGRALHDARDAAPGDRIEAKLYAGSLTARVEGIAEDE